MSASPVEERPFALRRAAAFDFIEGLNRTKEALREQGFDVATTLDASGALGGAFTILGVCDADLLRRAIEADPDAAALLPFSVAVQGDDDGIVVEAVDPTATLGGVGNDALGALAAEVRERLVAALGRIPAGSR
ncbi:MAG: DUF302 domain-containing protein [Chloroflexi bacterium]|nr:DUF302 domain-containing protein [Chloroflexota bacterium]